METAVASTIDGVLGAVVSLTSSNGNPYYLAHYHPIFDPKRVNVTITSDFPWDYGTLQLLKTIHVRPTSSMV